MAKRNTIADPDCNGWFSGRQLQQLLQSALDARQGKAYTLPRGTTGTGAQPMPSFDIARNRRHLEWRRQLENAPWLIEAVLLERVLLGGGPQLRIVCRLAAIEEDRTSDAAAQEKFWYDARARLGRFLKPRDRAEIERLLAKRVPVPVAATGSQVIDVEAEA